MPGMNALEEQFAPLQATLPDLWRRLRDPRQPRFVIAVPSLSLDLDGLPLPGGLLHFEERMLYLFHLLGLPACRLWFHSSHLIPEEEVGYYLHFLRHVPFSHGRNRLKMMCLLDRSPQPLTAKLLQRPALLQRLRQEVKKQQNAYLTVYRSTQLEMQLAVELGVPILGTDPRHQFLSTKDQARAIFQSQGIGVAPGRMGLHSLEELAGALLSMLEDGTISLQQPQLVVKQNEGVSGLGNRRLSIMPFWNLLTSSLEPTEKQARLAQSLLRHWGDAEGKAFWPRFERLGGLVETYLEGESVSVQLNLSPLGEVSVVGSHHERLDAQGRYVGSSFPAPDALAGVVLGPAQKVAQALVDKGVNGRVEVDFLVTGSAVFGLDINFRKSNTNASLRTLNLLAGGGYSTEENRYREGSGSERYVYSSDWLEVSGPASSPQDIIDVATEAGLHYSTATHSGVIFHMLGGASATRRLGVTCVGASADEAEQLYKESGQVLA
jgi:hypothetical protein